MKSINLLLKLILGNLLLALTVNLFILPHHFISGGSTGLALILQALTHLPYTLLVYIINIFLFVVGLICLGKKFALKSLLSTFIYPICLQLTSPLSLNLNPLPACILAGIMMGCALGIVIKSGASTGGMDIPPLVLNHYFNFDTAKTMAILDGILLFIQLFLSSIDGVIYGFILVILTSLTLNFILKFKLLIIEKRSLENN